MGLPNVGNQGRFRLSTDFVFDGGIHVNRSPLGRDFYVMTSAQQAKLKGDLRSRSFTTVNAAFNACEANRGDKIFVAEGYTETVHVADQWSNNKAGVRVIGLGTGTNRPKFTWDATAATILLSAANIVVENCQFEMAGDPAATAALTVAKGIGLAGAGCGLVGNHFQCGVDADQLMTLGVLVNASKCFIVGNKFIGDPAAPITAAGTVIRLTAADQFEMFDNYLSAGLATVTDGLVETLTTASLDINIQRNYFRANTATDTCAVDFGAALACTGHLNFNQMVVGVDATATTVIFTVSGTCNLDLGPNNYAVNDNNQFGIVIGTTSA